MTRLILAATSALATLSLAACDYDKQDYNEANAAYNAEGAEGYANQGAAAGGSYDGAAAAAGSWPEGARIVEENGVTYRIDSGGTRVRLEPGSSYIVVEDGVRYRVDPGGARVRIGTDGAVIVGDDGVRATVPVGGNTSVTVNSQ